MKKVFKTAAFMLAMGLMTSTFTACGEDDENENGDGTGTGSVDEVLKSNGIVARAQTSGKVIIDGSITSNKKIKWFGLSSTESKDCDIANWSDDAQQKTKDPEDGKSFTLTLSGKEVSMSEFPCYLTIKTDGKKLYEKVGEEFTFKLGDKNSPVASYGSLKDNTTYKLADFWDGTKITDVEKFKALDVVLKDGKYLKPISEATFYQTAKSKNDPALAEGTKSFIGDGTIVSANNIIARVGDGAAEEAADGSKTVTFSGVAVGVKGSVTVSVKDCEASLSK